MSGRAPLQGVVTLGQGPLAARAARKSCHPGGGFCARKSGWAGSSAFPAGDDEEEEEEMDRGEGGSDEEGSGDEGDGEQAGEPASLAAALLETLEAAEAPGDFAAGGKLRLVLPGLELLSSTERGGGNGDSRAGSGTAGSSMAGGGSSGGGKADIIGLPLSEAAAARLKAACELAPFGRRDKTLRDAKVRHTWQLDPDGFRLSNPQWQQAVDKAVAGCCDTLGVTGVAVEAQLYKLLLYEEGSHFGVHRDTEKAENMWGTLVVHLPTAYEGGQLVVSHGGRTKTFDFSADSAYSMHYAAFYADCNHEVKPVTSGHRLVLIYNLVSKRSGQRPQPADHSEAVAAARAVAQRWERELEEGNAGTPAKLVYLLEHLYSQDGLRGGLAALKGADRSRGQVLAALQEEGLLEVHLALVHRYEYGNDGEYEGSEQDVKQWVGLDGRPAPELGTMDLYNGTELCQGPDYFEDTDPDDEEQEPDTGNEGAPCTRWYKRTALVVWPKSRRFDMRCKGGLKPAAEGLLKAVQQGSHPKDELHEWAAALLRSLLTTCDPAVVSALLSAVAELRDAQLAEQCLAALSKAGTKDKWSFMRRSSGVASCFKAEHAPAVVRLCQLGGWSQPCTAAVEALLAGLAEGKLDALPSCAALLRQLHKVAGVGEAAARAAAAESAGAAAGAAAAAGALPASAAAAAAALLNAGLAQVRETAASQPRADAPGKSSYVSTSDVSRMRAAQAAVGAGLVQLLSLMQELGDEAALESFLTKAYAKHFIAAEASGSGGMLPALLAACGKLGWASPRTAAVLSQAAAACAAIPNGCTDFLQLAQGVQAAAGQAAGALLPQLTAAFLQALPAVPPSNVYLDRGEETRSMQALLDWLAERGSAQHFGTYFARVAARHIDLKTAVTRAVQVGKASGWWAEAQSGLLAAFSKAHSEADMPAVLDQLRRVRQASGVDGGTAGSAAARQRYVQLVAAAVGVLEREQDRDMTPHRPVSYQRGRYGARYYHSAPSMPPRTADFVRDVLLAAYVPGCSDADLLLGRAAPHVSHSPLRYPVASVVLPALESMAHQLQLGSLAAAVQAVPAVRAMVHQAASALRSQIPRPPVLPTDWSRQAEAPRVRCGAARCADCPAVRAFLENARQSEQRFVMGATRRKHLSSALSRAGAIPGFSWRDDGAAIVCSKRGIYEAAVSEYNRKHSAWQQLQAALGAASTQSAAQGGGGGPAAQPAQQQQQQQQQQAQQRAAVASGVIDLTGGSPAAKKRRL